MKISVIITAHNRQQYLLEAARSVQKQTLDRDLFEVIVIKNFENREIDIYLDENKFKKILVPTETIVGSDLYEAISVSTGDILTFLDDDDIFLENKLALVYETFKDDKVGYLKNEIFFIDKNGDRHDSGKSRLEIRKNESFSPSSFPYKVSHFNKVKAGFNLSSISLRRDLIKESDMLFLKDKLVQSTDTFFFSCALGSQKDVVLISKRLTGYRIGESTSKQVGNDKLSIENRIRFWKKLLDSYKELDKYFQLNNNDYLKIRGCSQALAIKILERKYGVPSEIEFALSRCCRLAIRNLDLLLGFDILRFLTSKLVVQFRKLPMDIK